MALLKALPQLGSLDQSDKALWMERQRKRANTPRPPTCAVEVGTDVMRKAILGVGVTHRSAGAAGSATSVAGIANAVRTCHQSVI